MQDSAAVLEDAGTPNCQVGECFFELPLYGKHRIGSHNDGTKHLKSL